MIQSISGYDTEIIELDPSSLKHANNQSDHAIQFDLDDNHARCCSCFHSNFVQVQTENKWLKSVYQFSVFFLFNIPLLVLLIGSFLLWATMIDRPHCLFPYNPFTLFGVLCSIISWGLCIKAPRSAQSMHTSRQTERKKNKLIYPGFLIPMYIATVTIFLFKLKEIAGPNQNSCTDIIKNYSTMNFQQTLFNNSLTTRSQPQYSTHVSFTITNSTNTQAPYNYTSMVSILERNNITLLDDFECILSLTSYTIIWVCIISMIIILLFAIFASCITMGTHWRLRPRLHSVSTTLSRLSPHCCSRPVCQRLHCILWALCTFAWPFVLHLYCYNEVFLKVDPHLNIELELEEHQQTQHQMNAGQFIIEFGADTYANADSEPNANAEAGVITT